MIEDIQNLILRLRNEYEEKSSNILINLRIIKQTNKILNKMSLQYS